MTLEERMATLSWMFGMSMALNFTLKSALEAHEIVTDSFVGIMDKLDKMTKDMFYSGTYITKDRNRSNNMHSTTVDPRLFTPLWELDGMSQRALSCLKAENMTLVGDVLCNEGLKDGHIFFYKIPNFGKHSFNSIKEALERHGFQLEYIECPEFFEHKRIKNE